LSSVEGRGRFVRLPRNLYTARGVPELDRSRLHRVNAVFSGVFAVWIAFW
jgi:hypothetical protein